MDDMVLVLIAILIMITALYLVEGRLQKIEKLLIKSKGVSKEFNNSDNTCNNKSQLEDGEISTGGGVVTK